MRGLLLTSEPMPMDNTLLKFQCSTLSSDTTLSAVGHTPGIKVL